MAVSFLSLLKLADFPKDRVSLLERDINYVSEDEKFRLANLAWSILAKKYFLKLHLEKERIFEEIKQGKRKYNPNDFEEAKAKLLHEFAQKLESAETEESVEKVRKQLEKFKAPPFLQDKATSLLPQKQ